jgi:hypothetical protein
MSFRNIYHSRLIFIILLVGKIMKSFFVTSLIWLFSQPAGQIPTNSVKHLFFWHSVWDAQMFVMRMEATRREEDHRLQKILETRKQSDEMLRRLGYDPNEHPLKPLKKED